MHKDAGPPRLAEYAAQIPISGWVFVTIIMIVAKAWRMLKALVGNSDA